MKNIDLYLVLLCIVLFSCKSSEEIPLNSFPISSPQLSISDLHGNVVTTTGMKIVDWEGPVRNPYIEFRVQGTDSIRYPISVNLETSDGKSYFDMPSQLSEFVAAKTIQLTSANETVPFMLSYFPDEDYKNDTLEVVISYTANGMDFNQKIPLYVIDQDYNREISYPVTIDFSESVDDMFDDPKLKEVIKTAAEHWVYYLDGEELEQVASNSAFITIGGNGHPFDEKTISNPIAYTGFYLFIYDAISSDPCICSTGFPSQFGKLQDPNKIPVPVMGAHALNIQGNFNISGYLVQSPFDNWTQQNVFPRTDLYSLVLHEIGHAIAYEYLPKYIQAIDRGYFESPLLSEYYPNERVPLQPESPTHIIGVTDPASKQKPYGGNIDDFIPGGRELITKLDILIMESVGYPIRENEVTKAMSLDFTGGRIGYLNEPYELLLRPSGGIPIYDFELIEGELPKGLFLDSQTGQISGVPTTIETRTFLMQIRDYSMMEINYEIEIKILERLKEEIIASN